MHLFSNEENDKQIDVYEQTETGVARERVQDAETVIQHEQEDMRHAQQARLRI
jgi:hypothetical protein